MFRDYGWFDPVTNSMMAIGFFIYILPHFFGLNGIWIAIPTADLCSSMLTGIWLFFELRHLRDRHDESIQ